MISILTAGGPGPFDPKKDKPTLPVKTADKAKKKK
jgi:hypothetical protein